MNIFSRKRINKKQTINFKKQYDIIRIGSYPTIKQHGRGRHNLELSKVYTSNTLFITWKTRETLVDELKFLDIKQIRFYEKSVRNNNTFIEVSNRLLRIVMLINFSAKSIIFSLRKSAKTVHIHSPMFLAIGIGLKLSTFGRIKLLMSYHGEDYFHTVGSPILKFLVKTFVDKALFISWTQWEECTFAKDKYWTPNGIESSQWTKPEGIKRKVGSVISVGKFKPQKNFLGLLHAWQKVVRTFPNAHLTIVGEGEQEEKIKKLINALDITHSVTVMPFQSLESLRKLYWQHEIFISNSIWEGFAKVVLEALACECKIAVTAVDSHKKVFQKWPFLIKPDSVNQTELSLMKILNDDYPWGLHRNISKSFDTVQLHKLYKKILNDVL